ncbi:hypothetical protein JD844_016797 [Phrynosoma platyrhinos]|uniref:Serpin domain-containing protein n=1 Tax=Phrynosoma platyrhinos TaxID=52577 RepID=A0ABQ7SKY4_PHRPL|nr:hypothetical protein JD844_016797 [Phrynosoma platyrhinos]
MDLEFVSAENNKRNEIVFYINETLQPKLILEDGQGLLNDIMTTLPEANAKFAVDTYQSLRKEHPCDNLLFAPVNATSALGLLALASGCEQAAEIEKYCPRQKNKPAPGPDLVLNKSAPNQDNVLNQHVPNQDNVLNQHVKDQDHALNQLVLNQPAPGQGAVLNKHAKGQDPVLSLFAPLKHLDVPDYECETPKGVHTAFSQILAALNAPSTNYTLSFANKLYGDHAIAFIQKFIYCALKLYWTDVEGADFQNAPEEVRRIINLWVEVQTHGKVKNLLPKDSFDCLVQLLLVNALYFKGQWQVKFDKELTVEAPFYPHYADQRDCYTVQLMNRKGVYNTGTFDICNTEVQVLEVPYKDHELSLFILLPTDCSPEALEQLEDALSYEHLLDWSCDLKPEEVDVFIPKFSLEKKFYLHEYLDLQDLSDPEKADFSQATTTEGVALTQLVHDAFLEIDEEGGEEAEARRCPRDRRPRREAVQFVADHPFLYFVSHNCTQSIVLLGKFARP